MAHFSDHMPAWQDAVAPTDLKSVRHAASRRDSFSDIGDGGSFQSILPFDSERYRRKHPGDASMILSH